MTTPELPPLRRYDLCLRGYENTMKRADDGDYCDNDDREARERILQARIAELEADAARKNMLRNANRTRSRCYHYVVSLGELGICGNSQAAAAFMATAKEMRAPHVGRKQIKRIALEASGGAFGHSDDPYVDAEAIDAARSTE